MRISYTLCTLFLSILTSQSFSQWSSGSLSGNQESIAAFDDDTFAFMESEGLLLTNNAGEDFDFLPFIDTNGFIVVGFAPTDLEFIDETTLLCSATFVGGAYEAIFKSTDSGESWSAVYERFGLAGLNPINDLDVSGQTVYAATNTGEILKSTNGGDTFTTVYSDPEMTYFQVSTFDGTQVTVAGSEHLLTSNDGGENWSVYPIEQFASGVDYSDAQTIVACTGGNQIHRSTDGGANWTQFESPQEFQKDIIHYQGNTWFMAAGQGYWRSDDVGENWYFQTTPTFTLDAQAIVSADSRLVARSTNRWAWTSNPLPIPTNYIRLLGVTADDVICAGEGDFYFEISNFGANDVESLTIEVYIDGSLNSTVLWEGMLEAGSYEEIITVQVPTPLSSGFNGDEYRFKIIEVNDVSNTYFAFDEQTEDFEVEGFRGTFSIGPGGDYANLIAFNDATSDGLLCGDLEIKLLPGTYSGVTFGFSSSGFGVSISPESEGDQVFIEGTLSAGGGILEISDLVILPGEISNGAFLIAGAGVDCRLNNINIQGGDITGTQGIRVSSGGNITIQNCDVQVNSRGMRISGSGLDTLSVIDSHFDIQGDAFLFDNNIQHIYLKNSILSVTEQVVDVIWVSSMHIEGNEVIKAQGAATLFEASSFNQSEDQEFLFENNVFQIVNGNYIRTNGNLTVRNNAFLKTEVNNSSDFPIIVESGGNDYVRIYNNIFSVDNSLIGTFINTNTQSLEALIDYNSYFSSRDNPWQVDGGFTLEEQLAIHVEETGLNQNSFILDVEFDPEILGLPLSNAFNVALINKSPFEAPLLDKDGVLRDTPLADIGPYELALTGLDLGVSTIYANQLCLGETEVYAVLTNLGGEVITDYSFNWSFDNLSGTIDIQDIALSSLDSDTLLLTSTEIDMAGVLIASLEILNVNGGDDDQIENNNFNQNLEFANIPGIMQVGEGQAYASLEEAMLVLETEGMCGPITISIEPGAYTLSNFPYFDYPEEFEQFPLTIQSSTENAEDVSINISALQMRFTNYLDLSIRHLSILSSGVCVELENESDKLLIESCDLRGIIFMDEENDGPPRSSITLRNNHWTGTESYTDVFRNFGDSPIESILIEGNTSDFPTGTFGGNIEIRNAQSVIIQNNQFQAQEDDCIEVLDCQDILIQKNQLRGNPQNAIKIDWGSVEGIARIENNFIGLGELGTAIRLSDDFESQVQVFQNTLRGGNTSITVIDCILELKNNIVQSNDRCMSIIPFSLEEHDFQSNIYYSTNPTPFGYLPDNLSLENLQANFETEFNSSFIEIEFDSPESYETSDLNAEGQTLQNSFAGLVEDDIEGNPRSELTPDFGAYEFGVILLGDDLIIENVSADSLSCTEFLLLEIEVRNNGFNTVDSFEYSIDFQGSEYTGNWLGTLEVEQSTFISLEGLPFSQGKSTELELSLTSVNGNSDGPSVGIPTLYQVPKKALIGIQYIGDASVSDFFTLQDAWEHLEFYGFCGDVELLLLPGSYLLPELDKQPVFSSNHLKISSLTSDASSVELICQGQERGLNLLERLTVSHVSFDMSNGTLLISEISEQLTLEHIIMESAGLDSCIISNVSSPIIGQSEVNATLIFESCTSIEFNNSSIEGELIARNNDGAIFDRLQINSEEPSFGAIYLNEHGGELSISNNLIDVSGSAGIRITGDCACDHSYQISNTVIRHSGMGYGFIAEGISNLELYHNTISTDSGFALFSEEIESSVIANNIFQSGSNWSASWDWLVESNSSNHNVYWAESEAALFGIAGVEALNALVQNSGNAEINPMLNPNGYSFSNPEIELLGSSAPGIAIDFIGQDRDLDSPTPGAIESAIGVIEPGDLNGDGVINSADLIALLGLWGCTSDCGSADINGDGVVNSSDLVALLSGF